MYLSHQTMNEVHVLAVSEGVLRFTATLDGFKVCYISQEGSFYTSDQATAELTSLCTKFNSQLQFSTDSIIKQILLVFKDPKKEELIQFTEHEFPKIVISSKLKNRNISLKWEFELTKTETLLLDFISPMLLSMLLLDKEKHALIDMIKKKDREIQEFKALALKLSQKSKISPMYDEKSAFKNIKLDGDIQAVLENDGISYAFNRSQEIMINSSTEVGTSKKDAPRKRNINTAAGISFDDSDSQPLTDFAKLADAKVKSEPSKKPKPRKIKRL